MVPFLKNSPNLSKLNLSDYEDGNENINTECFDVLMSALNGSSMEELYFGNCNIEDISALNTHTLPNLRKLTLYGNNIGRTGYITLSHLLESEASTLTKLDLGYTGMGNEEAEILAKSLKCNTSLIELELVGNNIGQRGSVAFLRLLNDVSSIDSTYNSNHTLTTLGFLDDDETDPALSAEFGIAGRQNEHNTTPKAAGRAKVIHSQLNSQTRKLYCQWQGIQYSSIGNLLVDADIESVLLPNILELIGNKHGQSELYAALIPLAPELLSYIDRKAIIETMMADRMAQIDARMAQIATLTAEHTELSNRLELIKLGDSKYSSSLLLMAGKKRERSDG